jgi:arginyl-tRNA synthetase
VGAQQNLHFEMLFEVAREAGWLPEEVRAEHAAIGSVLGTDGKILRTRSGAAVKLTELLDEAIERASVEFDKIEHDVPFGADERAAIARAVGIGAAKYADLSVARDSDYVFDLDRMISFRGNTGPYLQYATARIRSIFRRGDLDLDAVSGPMPVGHEAERALALKLLGFGAAVAQAAELAQPHRLCAYIYEVATAYTAFYENCPVLKAPDEETRRARLALCALTLRTLVTGLGLLGITAPDRM